MDKIQVEAAMYLMEPKQIEELKGLETVIHEQRAEML
jgi:hypothetical protein